MACLTKFDLTRHFLRFPVCLRQNAWSD